MNKWYTPILCLFMLIHAEPFCQSPLIKKYSLEVSFLSCTYNQGIQDYGNSGLENENSEEVLFSLASPFWKKWWFILLATLLITTMILAYLRIRIKRLNRITEEKEVLSRKAKEMEMRFLSSQMNRHFTFNVMNSIQSYILDNEPRQAQLYLAKYAKLIRGVLNSNMNEYCSIEDERNLLKMYLDIENIRFAVKFDFKITIDFENPEDFFIPPMIIMTYVENAVWHGILKKKKAGKIDICFQKTNDLIKCTVIDNGLGRESFEDQADKEHGSLGMYITQERLKCIQTKNKKVLAPIITNLKDEKQQAIGMKVEIFFPILHKDFMNPNHN